MSFGQGRGVGSVCSAYFEGTKHTHTHTADLATGILFPVSRGISKAEDPAAAAVALRDAMNECRAAWMAKRAAGAAGGGAEESLEGYQKEFLDL